MTPLSITILEIGMALTFAITGFLILKDDDKWVHMLPKWFAKNKNSAKSFMIGTALFDILLAIWLVSGIYPGTVSIIMSLHLFGVLLVSGKEEFHEVYRDIGLMFGTIAISVYYLT